MLLQRIFHISKHRHGLPVNYFHLIPRSNLFFLASFPNVSFCIGRPLLLFFFFFLYRQMNICFAITVQQQTFLPFNSRIINFWLLGTELSAVEKNTSGSSYINIQRTVTTAIPFLMDKKQKMSKRRKEARRNRRMTR